MIQTDRLSIRRCTVNLKRLFLIAALLLFGIHSAWAQGVGKISGKIVDVATGDPIPSVNVGVVGTSLGGTTNVDGEFFILNVPIGMRDLKVTSVGYETQTITRVEVLADQTFALTVKLKETVLQGEEVTVVAERDVIKRDITTTVRSMPAKELQALPVTTYIDALAKTAGAVGQKDNLHIRGGRRDQILYLIDGLNVKDPQFSRRSLDISQDAIGEMQVLTAGFLRRRALPGL